MERTILDIITRVQGMGPHRGAADPSQQEPVERDPPGAAGLLQRVRERTPRDASA